MNDKHLARTAAFGAFVAGSSLPFGPRINFAPPDDIGGAGSGSNDDSGAGNDGQQQQQQQQQQQSQQNDQNKTKEPEGGKEKPVGGSDDTLLREVMEKKKKLREMESEREALKQELAKYSGINLEEVNALVREKADRERQEAEAKGEFDRVKQMMAEEHKKALEALQAQLQEVRDAASRKDQVIDNLTIGSSFSGSKFIQEELTLPPSKARQIYGSHFEVVDGKIVGYDKPAGSANRTPLTDASGDNLSFEEAFKRIIDADPERDTMLRAKLAPGAQSRTQQTQSEKKDEKQEVFGLSRIAMSLKKGK